MAEYRVVHVSQHRSTLEEGWAVAEADDEKNIVSLLYKTKQEAEVEAARLTRVRPDSSEIR
jgi:hypothetical protein